MSLSDLWNLLGYASRNGSSYIENKVIILKISHLLLMCSLLYSGNFVGDEMVQSAVEVQRQSQWTDVPGLRSIA